MSKYEVTKSELYNTLSQKEKVLFILYDNPNININRVVKLLLTVNVVNSVNSVNEKNQDNNINNVNNINKLTSTLKVVLSRLVKNVEIIPNKTNTPNTYELTAKAINFVEKVYLEYKKNNDLLLKKQEQERNQNNILNDWNSFFEEEYSQKIVNNKSSGKMYISIDFSDIYKFNTDLADVLLDDPENTIRYAQHSLKEIFGGKMRIKLYNIPKSSKTTINNLRAKDVDRLSFIVGEIRSRSQSSLQIASIIFECPACGSKIPVLQLDDILKEPSKCSCGRKGDFTIIEQEVLDILKISVSDLYENLNGYESPEEILVILREDIFDFSKFNEGDRVRICGVLKHEYIKTNGGKKKTELQKYYSCLGIEKLDDDYNKIFITEEDEKKFEEIKKDPFKFHKDLMFNDLDDVDLPIQVATIGLYGNLHILFGGSPGTGKSVICERASQVSLRGSFVDVISASASGVLGATTKNQFTGKYSLDGGVFRIMSPGGIVTLDEINRDNEDKPIQRACIGIMSRQKLNVHKANVKIDEDCDVSIWATANPIKPYDIYKKEHFNFKIEDALFDRFDIVVFFTNKLNIKDLNLIESIVEKSNNKFIIPNDKLELLKKYQIKSKLINFKLKKEDYKTISLLIKEYFDKIDPESSYRRIKTIKKFIEAICRLYHRESPNKEDYKILTDLITNLKIRKELFLLNEKDYNI